MRHFYAALNSYADLRENRHGFVNTWTIYRFPSVESRNSFVERHWHKSAKAVTRKEAEEIFADTYRSVGKDVPVGGLFERGHYCNLRFIDMKNAKVDEFYDES